MGGARPPGPDAAPRKPRVQARASTVPRLSQVPMWAGHDNHRAPPDRSGDARPAASSANPPASTARPAGSLPLYLQLASVDTPVDVPASELVERARQGTTGSSGGPLPFAAEIQRSFGRYDISGARSHADSGAREAAHAIGAEAFTIGDQVAFSGTPNLRTAAHEAAHVVQQRAGVDLQGGVGRVGDPYERNADAVAERVVTGRSAEPLLARMAPGGGRVAPARPRARASPPEAAPDFQALLRGGSEVPPDRAQLLAMRRSAGDRAVLQLLQSLAPPPVSASSGPRAPPSRRIVRVTRCWWPTSALSPRPVRCASAHSSTRWTPASGR